MPGSNISLLCAVSGESLITQQLFSFLGNLIVVHLIYQHDLP